MATEKSLAILEEIKSLTILELADLVKAVEEEFGVSAAAPVAVAGAGAAATRTARAALASMAPLVVRVVVIVYDLGIAAVPAPFTVAASAARCDKRSSADNDQG